MCSGFDQNEHQLLLHDLDQAPCPPLSSGPVLSPLSKTRTKHSAQIVLGRRPASEGCCGWALRRALSEAAMLNEDCFFVWQMMVQPLEGCLSEQLDRLLSTGAGASPQRL